MFEANSNIGVLSALGVILGAVYMLSLYKRVMLGKANESHDHFTKLSGTEQLTLMPLLLLVICLGVVPNIILGVIDAPVTQLMQLITPV